MEENIQLLYLDHNYGWNNIVDDDKIRVYCWCCGIIFIVLALIIAFPTLVAPIWYEAAQNIEIPGFEPTLFLSVFSLLGVLIVISYHNKFKKKLTK